MSKTRVGKLPPRYTFLLNPHADLRFSKCPDCGKQTFARKFPLFIHIEGWGPLTMGKTCKYCSTCELIVCHQDEFDEALTRNFAQLKPEVIGNDYFVIGTVEPRVWKAGMKGNELPIEEGLKHVADFKKHLTMDYDPGGWRPADADPERWIIRHDVAVARRKTPWTLGKAKLGPG